MDLLKKISLRLLFVLLLGIGANEVYTRFFWQEILRSEAPVLTGLLRAADSSEVIYFGESSNTSSNPFRDTLTQSICEFTSLHFPDRRFYQCSHPAYHTGMYVPLLRRIPDGSAVKAVILTLNLRTHGSAAVHSPLEANLQKQKVYYMGYPPLLARLFLTLKYYDNRDSMEQERLKFAEWRTQRIDRPGFQQKFRTLTQWMDAPKWGDANRWPPTEKRVLADHYIKAYAFLLDENNPRVRDMDEAVKLCLQRGWKPVLNLLPENTEYARVLFGDTLVQYMEYNRNWLRNRYSRMGATVVDNFNLVPGSDFTDQFWPTEHYGQTGRSAVAKNLALALKQQMGWQMRDSIPPLPANYRPDPRVPWRMATEVLRP